MAPPLFANVPVLTVAHISEEPGVNQPVPDEELISLLEMRFPFLIQAACKLARWQALASGQTLLEVEGDYLVRITPDGTKTVIRHIPK